MGLLALAALGTSLPAACAHGYAERGDLCALCRLEEKEQQLVELQSQKAALADQVEVLQVRSAMGGGPAPAAAAAAGAGGSTAAAAAGGAAAGAAGTAALLASLKLEGSDLESAKELEAR